MVNQYNDYIEYHDITKEEIAGHFVQLDTKNRISSELFPVLKIDNCRFRLLTKIKVELFYRRGRNVGSAMLEDFLLQQSNDTVILVDYKNVTDEIDSFLKKNNFISLQPLSNSKGCYFYANTEEALSNVFNSIFDTVNVKAASNFAKYLESIGIEITLEDEPQTLDCSVPLLTEQSVYTQTAHEQIPGSDSISKVNQF